MIHLGLRAALQYTARRRVVSPSVAFGDSIITQDGVSLITQDGIALITQRRILRGLVDQNSNAILTQDGQSIVG